MRQPYDQHRNQGVHQTSPNARQITIGVKNRSELAPASTSQLIPTFPP